MDDFLERIKVLKRKQIKLPISKSEFINRFRQNVDEGDIGMFSGTFEAFSSSKNKYKGSISSNSFKMRKRRELFDRGRNLAKITAQFRQQEDHTLIDLEIKGFHYFIIFYYVFITIFYIIFLSFSGFLAFETFAIFIIIHAVLMYCLPYFFMRKQTKNTAEDIEKELFFMTR
ncbi:hypothetical protein U8527_12910 [Kordia algicida OT-1]|uniref:Uncharacterized protein n=1 Tax=Kordia algicida OT-1 TaxID=391587 RepID=A9E4M8_9FLAO|nr:hypothetical protein [Kordia algicida]EDP95109.1 hypothetical protein KAOT1_06487 [Kordia algicida OT-1]